MRQQYKQQDSSPSVTVRQAVPKQTQTYVPIRWAHSHLGFDFSRPIAMRVEVCDPVHHILNACLNSGLDLTEDQHDRRALPTLSPWERTIQLRPTAWRQVNFAIEHLLGCYRALASSSLGYLRGEICLGLVEGKMGCENESSWRWFHWN